MKFLNISVIVNREVPRKRRALPVGKGFFRLTKVLDARYFVALDLKNQDFWWKVLAIGERIKGLDARTSDIVCNT